jgi:phage terminase large subunit-like protein
MPMSSKRFDHDKAMYQLSEQIKENSRHPNIKKYVPHEKQVRFHSSEKKRKLYLGGNRSGKTVGGVTEGIWRATCTHPYRPELNSIGPNTGRVIGVDFTQGIEKILIPQYKQWLYPSALRGGSWDSAYEKWTRTLNFSNGSTIEFMSYDQDLDKFAGTSRHWVHFDEEPPRSIWVENLARLIDTDGEFWITMTPVEGITWVYEDLYETNVNNADGEVEVIEINSIENPYLSATALTSFSNVLGDGEDVNIRIGGGFESKGGRVYKNFDPTVGGVHVLAEPVESPKDMFPNANWLWIMGLDHGLKNPTAVLWMAVNEYGFCVVFDEHYRNELVIEEHATLIKEKIKAHGRFPDILVADPSIRNRLANTGVSTHQEYAKFGLPFTLGNNDIKSGIVRVKRYFGTAPLVAGVNYRSHPLFPKAGDSYSRLRIAPNCSNLIKEGKLYRFKTYANKRLNDERNPYDEPNPKDDHALDALRYMIMTQPDLVGPNPNTTKSDIDNIVDALQEQIVRNHAYREVADPHGYLEAESGWNPENSLPSGDAGWQYDEHMGVGF